MYANFFGLRCLPFEDRADTQFFFATAERDEALAALQYEAQYGKGMSLLLGESGTGKTLLIRTLMLRLDTPDQVVILTRTPAGEMSILREACKAFGVTLPSSETAARCLARLRRHLIRSSEAQRRSILIIDQAENLTVEDLRQLATLTDLENDDRKLLTIFVVGQPQFQTILARPEFARLDQQLFGRRALPELTLPLTEQYIQHRLAVAGAGEAEMFDRDAVAIVHAAAKGIPRLINSICNAAMLAAYGAGQQCVTREIAVEVTQSYTTSERSAAASHVGLPSASRLASGYTDVDAPDAGAWPQREPSRPLIETGPDGYPGDAEFRGQLGGIQANLDDLVSPGFDDAASQTATSSSVALLGVEGEALIDRMERTIARAEQVGATSHGALTQQAAVEKHLELLSARAERLIAGLGQAVHRATDSFARLQGRSERIVQDTEAGVTSMVSRLTHATDAAGDVEEQAQRIEAACELAERVESRVTSFAEQLAARAGTVQEQMARLMTSIESNEAVSRTLESKIEQASTTASEAEAKINVLRDKVQQDTEAYERKHGELAAKVNESADQTLRAQEESIAVLLAEHWKELDKGFDARHRVLESSCQAVEERMEAHCTKLRDMISASASDRQLMDAEVAAGRERIGELRESLEVLEARRANAEAATCQLRDNVERISGRADELVEITTNSVDELSDRADTSSGRLSDVVERAEKLLLDVQRNRGQIEGMQHQLANTLVDIGSACQRAEAARDACGVLDQAREAVGAADQTTAEACQRTADRFGGDVNGTDNAVDTGRRLLKEFATQSESLGRELEKLHRKTAELEAAVSRATAKPNEVIAAAQVHAAQLERICGAVRKVSAGLSKTTLNAKRQMEELKGTSENANEQLSRLAAQTDRSSSTLREWVNEAVQVQSRLDRTLRRCPSIHETHSGDSLQEIHRMEQPVSRVANPSAAVDKSPVENGFATGDANKSRSKVEKIAQLIQEAKRAAGKTT